MIQAKAEHSEPKWLTSLIISISAMVGLILLYSISLRSGSGGGTMLVFYIFLFLPCLFIVPICSIVSFILAIRALKYPNNTYAIVSIIISSLTLLLWILFFM